MEAARGILIGVGLSILIFWLPMGCLVCRAKP